MTPRSYLSIGDVLTLLRQEFPDVTISKIRFLESQGLVDPERTPSGYRKFYRPDVDRLRWVLQQQRENFLPLKVIKDRLDDTDNPVVPAPPAPPPPPAPEPAAAGAAVVRPAPVLVGQHAGAGEGSGPGGLRLDEEPAFPGMEVARPVGGRVAAQPVVGVEPDEGGRDDGAHDHDDHGGHDSHDDGTARLPAMAAAGAAGERAASGRPGQSPAPSARGAATGDAEETGRGSSSAGAKASGGSHDASAGRGSGTASRSRSRGAKAATGGGRGTRGGGRRRSGASGHSAAELAEASGLSVESVEELAAYGLLAPSVVAGFATYDDVDLSVAKLAAQLGKYGIEPRHLRLYKNAADREAGFVEQVVLPLLRQRNPDARDRAESTAEELVDVGRELRNSLLQRSLDALLHP
jgi:DNA-binding transcriptional MerR regulator